MGNFWIAVIFIGFCFLGTLIFSLASRRYSKLSSEGEPLSAKDEKSAAEILKAEGELRSPENVDFDLPDEDFFINEKDEPLSFDEMLEGLSENEAETLLNELEKLPEEKDD